MEPLFTHDAVVLGILMAILAVIFVTASSDAPFFKKFYRFVPPLLLCYFIPAILHYPLGWIAPYWYDAGILELLSERGLTMPTGMSFDDVNNYLTANGVALKDVAEYKHGSKLYYVASRYLLPASLVLLCLGIDFKGVLNLGSKALIIFLTGTMGIVLGGPIALLFVTQFFPNLIPVPADELWGGLATIAGSWIGGGANQAAMKEIYEVADDLFAVMIVVDVVVANIWMGFLLYGAGITDRIDAWLKADTSSIKALEAKMTEYQSRVRVFPTTTNLFVMLAVAFGAVGIAHFLADPIAANLDYLKNGLMSAASSSFFWLIVISTTIGVAISFTRFRKIEGYGASNWGSVFIYILVATIGMKMNLGGVVQNLGLFAVGLIWMSIHAGLLIGVSKLIKAPFFFAAVGSQANVGGAASAPVVASAFNPVLAPVGALLAVLGYALGTFFAIVCATLMAAVVG